MFGEVRMHAAVRPADLDMSADDLAAISVHGARLAVDMPGRGRSIEPVAIGHADSDKMEVARELRESYPVGLDDPEGLAAVMRGDIPHWILEETPDIVTVSDTDGRIQYLNGAGRAEARFATSDGAERGLAAVGGSPLRTSPATTPWSGCIVGGVPSDCG